MPTGNARAKVILRYMRDFFWPPRSLISGARGMGRGPLSPKDFARLRFVSDPLCDRCGVPLDSRTGDETWCTVCIARPPRWDRARAALIYVDVSRRPALDLKRAGRRDGLETLCGWMRQAGGVLVRTCRTPGQAGLAGRAGRRNVSGAFKVRASRLAALKDKRLLLVDDVLMTGATLSACTRALNLAGGAAR